MRNPLKDMPRWIRVTFWATLALFLAAAIVPAALRTTVAGFRGDYDPQVKQAQQHERAVELRTAEARDTINTLERRNRALEKILKGEGSKRIPTGSILAVLAPCELEDGSTQDVCVWDGRKQGNGVGAIVVNLDYGSLSFYPQTNGWTVGK